MENQIIEEYLADRGFVREQHYQSDPEAIRLATKVQIEMDARTRINEEGFYRFEVECSRKCLPACRGWDGKSGRCECNTHWVDLVAIGSYPSAGCYIACRCCVKCPDYGCEGCEECEISLCSKCMQEHQC